MNGAGRMNGGGGLDRVRAWGARALTALRAPGTRRRRIAAALALVAPLALGAAQALARPGGGHGWSGGGGGGGGGGFSGGGGGGGGGDGIGLLLWLVFRYPQVGVPVLVAVGVAWYINRNRFGRAKEWATALPRLATNARRTLTALTRFDPDFSVVVFEDRLHALYVRAQEARGQGGLEALSAYLGPRVRPALAGRSPHALTDVRSVVVGAMRVLSVDGIAPPAEQVKVRLRFEAAYEEVADDGRVHPVYAVEVWTAVRARSARSRPPEAARVFDCPNCGAALDLTEGGRCGYCDTQVDTGAFDWLVTEVQALELAPRKPILTGTVPEQGTERPTVYQPGLRDGLERLKGRDPEFDLERFEARVRLVHREMYGAWSSLEWPRARPYLTDSLFESQQYWIDAYRRSGLRNVLENARVTRVEPVAAGADRWFDALTVRVWATGLDYTVDESGRVVGGSRRRERPFTEYWTLLRGHGAKGAATTEPVCPNCGAPLDGINMAGECSYCGATVTTGAFDWVLSRIEQDEVYTG